MSLVWLAPFYYLLISVQIERGIWGGNPLALPRMTPIIDNAVRVWTDAQLGWGLANSATYGLVGASLAVLIAAMAAFGSAGSISRVAPSGRADLLGNRLSLPDVSDPAVLQLPGARHSQHALRNDAVLHTRFCVPFHRRNFMGQLGNRETDAAARMEGASDWHIFFSIVLPGWPRLGAGAVSSSSSPGFGMTCPPCSGIRL